MHTVNSVDTKKKMRYVDFMARKKHNAGMGSIIIRDIDEKLRKEFRMLCLSADISMNQYLKDLIKRIVEDGKLK